jgi:hypothetical protein
MEEQQLQIKFLRPWQDNMGNSLFRFDCTDYGEVIQGTFLLFGYGYVIVWVKEPGKFGM